MIEKPKKANRKPQSQIWPKTEPTKIFRCWQRLCWAWKSDKRFGRIKIFSRWVFVPAGAVNLCQHSEESNFTDSGKQLRVKSSQVESSQVRRFRVNLQKECQPCCKQRSLRPLQGACLASPGSPPPPPPPSPACPCPPSPQPRPAHHHRGQEPPWERGGGEGRSPVTLLPSWPWPLSPGACTHHFLAFLSPTNQWVSLSCIDDVEASFDTVAFGQEKTEEGCKP